ncbi:hypothetical protein [Streptomyces sp. NBC_00005]|uniref:hypothetical protein n=1 Tax=Streptomyces sp. NBC_00005 TaxID=2903609 RepID=UPI0032431274
MGRGADQLAYGVEDVIRGCDLGVHSVLVSDIGQLWVLCADDFGGVVRYYEIPALVRVAAPVHLKFTVRIAPSLYPSGAHLDDVAVVTARERVRRAAIGLSVLRRHYPKAKASPRPMTT